MQKGGKVGLLMAYMLHKEANSPYSAPEKTTQIGAIDTAITSLSSFEDEVPRCVACYVPDTTEFGCAWWAATSSTTDKAHEIISSYISSGKPCYYMVTKVMLAYVLYLPEHPKKHMFYTEDIYSATLLDKPDAILLQDVNAQAQNAITCFQVDDLAARWWIPDDSAPEGYVIQDNCSDILYLTADENYKQDSVYDSIYYYGSL